MSPKLEQAFIIISPWMLFHYNSSSPSLLSFLSYKHCNKTSLQLLQERLMAPLTIMLCSRIMALHDPAREVMYQLMSQERIRSPKARCHHFTPDTHIMVVPKLWHFGFKKTVCLMLLESIPRHVL